MLQIRVKSKSIGKVTKDGVYYKTKQYGSLSRYLCLRTTLSYNSIVHKWFRDV